MIVVRSTRDYRTWFGRLRNIEAAARIEIRIRRMSLGNFGDVKGVGDGVSELRISFGSGYRVYFTQRGDTLVVLLCGGDKSTQTEDITKAKALAKEWTDGT